MNVNNRQFHVTSNTIFIKLNSLKVSELNNWFTVDPYWIKTFRALEIEPLVEKDILMKNILPCVDCILSYINSSHVKQSTLPR